MAVMLVNNKLFEIVARLYCVAMGLAFFSGFIYSIESDSPKALLLLLVSASRVFIGIMPAKKSIEGQLTKGYLVIGVFALISGIILLSIHSLDAIQQASISFTLYLVTDVICISILLFINKRK